MQLMSRNKLTLLETEITTEISTRAGARPPEKKQEQPKANSKNESIGNQYVIQDEEQDRRNISFHSFGAHFVKVLVDPITCMVKVDKIVCVMDVGKILNSKTAASQIMGGAIWGIGMALMEGSEYDPNTGRIVTRDLSEYLVPVHADMPDFDIQFIDKPDLNISPIGAKGAGEIGITGITAAIANAVYHATGKRVRDLPITPDKLL